MFLRPAFWLVLLAVLIFAIVQNTTGVLLFAFQAARKFRMVAVAVSFPPGAFFALAVASHIVKVDDYRVLIASYILGWTCLLIFCGCALQLAEPHFFLVSSCHRSRSSSPRAGQ